METYKIPDMSCGHCEKSITEALKLVYPSSQVSIDLKDKTLKVENIPETEVIKILDDIGYTAEKK